MCTHASDDRSCRDTGLREARDRRRRSRASLVPDVDVLGLVHLVLHDELEIQHFFHFAHTARSEADKVGRSGWLVRWSTHRDLVGRDERDVPDRSAAGHLIRPPVGGSDVLPRQCRKRRAVPLGFTAALPSTARPARTSRGLRSSSIVRTGRSTAHEDAGPGCDCSPRTKRAPG